MAWYRCEGTKSSEEIHGASITVTAIGNDLVGVACNLYNNTTLVASKVFPSSKVVIFDKLIDSGAYRASITVGDKTVNEGVSISDQDILDGASKSVSISTYVPPSSYWTYNKDYTGYDYGTTGSGTVTLVTRAQLQEAYNYGYRYINWGMSALAENLDYSYGDWQDGNAQAWSYLNVVNGPTIGSVYCTYDGNDEWNGKTPQTFSKSGTYSLEQALRYTNYNGLSCFAGGGELRYQRVTCAVWFSLSR